HETPSDGYRYPGGARAPRECSQYRRRMGQREAAGQRRRSRRSRLIRRLPPTALLMLDFMNQNCGQRPRCLDTIPAKKLLAEARSNKVPVIYSIIANSTPADVIKDVAPQADEPHVLSGPDKFRNTDLEKILKDKGIATVIAVGTSSNGAVL